MLRFDLFRDSQIPGAPGAPGYTGLWRHQLTFVDGLAWTGLFDPLGPDASLQSLGFDDGSTRSRSPSALTVDNTPASTTSLVRSDLNWGVVKNIAVDQFSGSQLAVENFVDAFIDLDANTTGQSITLLGAQRGRIETGSGNDIVDIQADYALLGEGTTFFVDTNGGDDQVTVRLSSFDYTASSGIGRGVREQFFTTQVHLGEGDDSFVGMGSLDNVWGGAGDDTAELRGGTNFLDGGAGYDTLVMRGDRASYRLDDLGQGRYRLWDNDRTADGDDGITVLWNTERVVFKDQTWVIVQPGNENAPPVAVDDAFTITGARVFAASELLGNDSDADGGRLRLLHAFDAVGGTAVRNAVANTVTFTPDAGFTGQASFKYQVGDGQGGIAVGTVTLIIGGGSALPFPGDDQATTDEDTAVVIDVRANDEPGDAPTQAAIIDGPDNGTVVLNADGTITYTPDADFNGSDTFTYRLTDADGETGEATVSITVAPVNDAPVANADAAVVDEGGSVTIDVGANDADVDGDSLTVVDIAVAPTFGTVSVVNGQVVYAAAPGSGGVVDWFSYVIEDGQGGSAIGAVTVTVGDVNTPPVAADDAATTDEDAAVTIFVLANDSDDDPDPLLVEIVGAPANGTAAVNGDGSITYTPAAHFNGADAITYRITDSAGQTAQATVAITVAPVDDVPVARDDVFFTFEDLGFNGAVGGNDSEYDNEARSYALVGTGPAGLAFNADGTFSYTPPPDFSGAVLFTYRLSDPGGSSDTADVLITVLPVPDAPVGVADAASTGFGTPVAIDVLANDSDADGDALQVGVTTAPANGTLSTIGGSITYTPNAGFFGQDSFTYRPTDGTAQGNETIVTVTVGAPDNTAPVATSDSFAGTEDTVLVGNVSLNDSDVDGDTLTYTLLGGPYAGVVLNADGSFTYTPPANFNGFTGFEYTVSDGRGGGANAGVLLSIAAVNDPPAQSGTPGTIVIEEDGFASFSDADLAALAGVTDIDGPFVQVDVTDATGGTHVGVTQFAQLVVFSAQPANFNSTLLAPGEAPISVTVTFSDGEDEVVVVLPVTITAVNDAPVATSDLFDGAEDEVLTGDLSLNDSDVDGDALTYTLLGGPYAGVVLNADGTFTYTPPPNFNGFTGFEYTVSDGQGGSANAGVVIAIAAVNDPVVAVDDSFTVQAGGVLQVAGPGVLANDIDIEGDAVLATFSQGANGAVLMQADGGFTYTPNPGFSGVDSFFYSLVDGSGAQPFATVTVTVVGANTVDAVDDEFTGIFAATSLPVLANDSDPQGDSFAIVGFTAPSNGSVVQVGSLFVYTPAGGYQGQDSFTYTIRDEAGAEDTATVRLDIIAPTADLSLTMQRVGSGEVVAGGQAVFDVTVTNAGLSAAGGTVRLSAGGAGDIVAVEGAGGAPVYDFATDTWTFEPLALGQQVTLRVTYAYGETVQGSVSADAEIYTAGVADPDSTPGNGVGAGEDDEARVDLMVRPLAADLRVDVAVGAAEVVVGGTSTVTFTVTNDGPDAGGFVFDLSTIAGNAFAAPVVVSGGSFDAVTGDWTFASLGVGQQATLTATYLFTAGNLGTNGIIGEIVSATRGDPDSTPGNAGFGAVEDDFATASVTVLPANNAPVAADDATTIGENLSYSSYHFVDVLANDTDADGDALDIVAVNTAGTPIIADVIGGQVRFFVNDDTDDTNGVFQISYTVSDQNGGTDTGQITITVTPENDPPRDPEGNDAALGLATAEDTALVISIAALLADDAQPADEAQAASLFDVSFAASGTIVDNGDGTLTFTPNANFNGTAAFYYRAQDDQGAVGNYVHVPVTVTAVNDPVVANDDIIDRAFQGGGSQTITRAQLLANNGFGADSVPDGDEVITAVAAVSGVTSVALNADQSVTVVYGAGQVPVFTYTLSDGTFSDTATVTLNSGPQVTEPPAALVWAEDLTDWRYDSVLIALAGVTDPDGDVLRIVDFESGSNFGVSEAFWDTAAYLYDYAYFRPFPQDFNGATTLTFTVSDGNSATDLTVTIDVIVTPVNDAPRDLAPYSTIFGAGVGTDGGFSTPEGTGITIQKSALLADKADPEGDAFSIVGFANNAFVGSVVDNGDSYTYTPYSFYADFVGEVAAFYYVLQDAQGAQSFHYVFIAFTNTPDPITANDDVLARTAGGTQVIAASSILGNDVDPDPGDTKTIVDLVANNGISAVYLDAGGNVVVEYAGGASTGQANFTYRVQDSTGNSDTATVFLNRAPAAADDGPLVMSEGPDTFFIPYADLLANDSDPDGQALSVSLYNWGYAGSNVFVYHGSQGGVGGVVVTLYEDEYTGPAEFQYRAFDGTTFSDIVTVSLTVVEGDDVPVANPDYWFYNGAQYYDINPATNDMVGIEDQVLTFPVSRLTQGQFINGVYQGGADENDDGTLEQLTIADISSPYGTVAIVEIGGVDHVQFTPFADVNSFYPWSAGSYDSYRIYLTYSVDDGTTVSNTSAAYLLILPIDDLPVAEDDSFTVFGNGPYTLDIGDQFGAYDVRANDRSPDSYPYSQWDYTSIVDAYAVSGGSVSWKGSSVTFTPDGSGDPMVFEYVLQEYDGDTDTAQVTLLPEALASTVFYFSGELPEHGRELWVYDPESYDENLGSPFATMVDEAETYQGSGSGDPREITALGNTVFWRGETYFDYGGEGSYFDYQWHAYNSYFGWQQLSSVNTFAFDGTLDQTERNLGVRSGDLFWGATYGEGDALTAWDAVGNYVTTIGIGGYDRTLLTDAGGDPAYAAMTSGYDIFGNLIDAEQLHVVLPLSAYGSWASYEATFAGTAANDIREIAGLSIQPNGVSETSLLGKILYFAGDFTDQNGTFQANGLWRVTLEGNGFYWNTPVVPEFIDNGSFGLVQGNPYALTVAETFFDTDLDPLTAPVLAERLFYFATDAAGQGQIATRLDSYTFGTSVSTGSDYYGYAIQGLEIRPWDDGVIFSGLAPDIEGGLYFVATWTDIEGDGFFALQTVFETVDGTIEQLLVDGQGNAVWVVDDGVNDTLHWWDGLVVEVLGIEYGGEITDLQLADDHVVFVAGSEADGTPTLIDLDLLASDGFEVPTDEFIAGGGGNGFISSYANVAIDGGLVFDADLGYGAGFRLLLTDGVSVSYPSGGGVFRTSEGASLNGSWVGTAFVSEFGLNGLYGIDGSGVVTPLYQASTNFSNEAEVLGQKVLFGKTSSAVNEVLVYDAATGLTSTLLSNHLLGAAATVGSGIVFNALDFGNAANTDLDTTNNVWTLYRYDGSSVTTLLDLPTGAGGGQHVYEWWRHQDFLGDDSRIFWKQANDLFGVEVHTIDLTAANPAGTLSIADINPGNPDGAFFADAVFSAGRLFFQGAEDGTFDTQTLYTTTDGIGATLVTGATAADAFSDAYQTVAIGDEVFFLGRKDGLGSVNFGVFQVNDDGVTASLITPGELAVFGLAAVESQLYFFGSELGSANSQMYSLTPGETPAETTPTQITNFFDIDGDFNAGDIFQGGGGNIFFSRSEPDTGRELWVLDASQETGARLVADINTDLASGGGYAPQQVVATPDPLLDLVFG
jgi:ELWxxDGT repeat protein